MASLIPSYEYDIFISYRQKDNKHDGWVTEFVDNLKGELESTFKEDISVYFDINPHDGLLETHDVDASLKEKLKCLVFIPIISRTYCDPKSFAWKHELKAFVAQASQDHFGLKVRLPNGNVASRVLPIRIHDLDISDLKECESVLGGVLRGVEFIYKEPGVNKPLTADDDEKKNLNNTKYRIQINKVANAISDIVVSVKNISTDNQKEKSGRKMEEAVRSVHSKERSKKLIFGTKPGIKLIITIALLILLVGVVFIFRNGNLKNSGIAIAIIPFTNPSDDNNLSKFAIGSMDAVITKLQEVKNLTIRPRVSCLQYLDTKEPLEKLINELNINYLVDLSVSKSNDKLKLWVGLTNAKSKKQLWAATYDLYEDQLMPLFTEIVNNIVKNLNIEYSSDEMRRIQTNLTEKPDAYTNYLAGNAIFYTTMQNGYSDSLGTISALKMYDKAIESDPNFGIAYAHRAIARSWGLTMGHLDSSYIEKCWSDISNAMRINKDLTDIQMALGFYYNYCKADHINALISFQTAFKKDPENYQSLFYMTLIYRRLGDWSKLRSLLNRLSKFKPQVPLYLTNIGSSYYLLHNYDSALIYHQKAIDIDPSWGPPYSNKIWTLVLKYGNTIRAHPILDSMIMNTGETNIGLKILLDIYDGNYTNAFAEADRSGPNDLVSSQRYLYLAEISNLLNNRENASRFYDSALVSLKLYLPKYTKYSWIHGSIGLAYAGKGNKEKAIEECNKAIELSFSPLSRKDNTYKTSLIVDLATIYTMLGLTDSALTRIDYLLKNPSYFSTKLLQIDPVFKPLLNLNECKKIIEKYDIEN